TAIHSLCRLKHRGAIAADGKTGDGCGVLLKKPDLFLRESARALGIELAPNYAAGMLFLNPAADKAARARSVVDEELRRQGLEPAGWRVVSTDHRACGEQALSRAPAVEQVFVNAPQGME